MPRGKRRKQLLRKSFNALESIETELLRTIDSRYGSDVFRISHDLETNTISATTYNGAFDDVLDDIKIQIDIPDVMCFIALVNNCKNSGGYLDDSIVNTVYKDSVANNNGEVHIIDFEFDTYDTGTKLMNARVCSITTELTETNQINIKTKLILQRTSSFGNGPVTDSTIKDTVTEMLNIMLFSRDKLKPAPEN
jgi:hypothetical protein